MTRELRELVGHRAKLVALRSSVKCQVHAVLAGAGVPVAMIDVFGVGGQGLLDRVMLSPAARARVDSARRVIECLDFEVEVFTNLAAGRLRGHRGYAAIQAIPGVGPILAAVFVAEIGEVSRFHRARFEKPRRSGEHQRGCIVGQRCSLHPVRVVIRPPRAEAKGRHAKPASSRFQP
jgi:transposase